MNLPPFLLGASLLFWGWQTELFWVGLALGMALEASRFVSIRWEFSQADFRRIWTLCTVFFLGATVYAFVAHQGTSGLTAFFDSQSMARRSESLIKTSHSVLALLQWMPAIFFPMVAAQVYGNVTAVDLRSLSWLLRRRRYREDEWPAPTLNLGYPYLMVCLLATSTTNSQPLFFFLGLCLLLGWALLAGRNQRFSRVAWAATLGVAVTLGFFGHIGLNHLQKIVQNLDTAWLSRLSRQDTASGGNRTALGNVGRIKLSGQIVLRVTAETQPVPALLREASYNLFKSPYWYSAQKEFVPLIVENDESTWQIASGLRTNKSVLISRFMDKYQLLPVPDGTERLEQLPVYTLKTNALGVLRVDDGPGLVSYRARFSELTFTNSLPEADDLDIPRSESKALETVAAELQLRSLTPAQALQTIRNFFSDQFRYTTYLDMPENDGRALTPLANFLLRRRAGHCEFFATATTLLLRQAGLPSRYAIGYAVLEQKGDEYVVRGRHGHAWAMVYFDGAWRDFDTTPPSWNAAEAEQASFWEPVRDFFSRLYYEFSKWRWGKTSFRKYVVYLIIPPLILAAGQLLLRKQWRRFRDATAARTPPVPKPGDDSEFYLIERRLTAIGLGRSAGEPTSAWVERLQLPDRPSSEPLPNILALHYRYRFDPKGLDGEARLRLKQSAEAWLRAEINPLEAPVTR